MVLLLELVIGLGIFVLALLFTFGLFVTTNRSGAAAKDFIVATDLAREYMEQQLALPYDQLLTIPPLTDLPPRKFLIDGRQSETEYHPEVRVTEEGPFPPPNDFHRKHILVVVSWPGPNGHIRSTQLETYVVQ